MISRRRFLLGSGGMILSTPVFSRVSGSVKSYPFTLGVASGSPAPDGAVLWTRLAPEPLQGGGMASGETAVRYRVCRDEGMRDTVRDAQFVTDETVGHSVHAIVEGLDPGRDYWYQFYVGDDESPVGRLRTTDPAAGSVRLAVASCQSYESGYYAAYRDMAEWMPDCVIHLGDYIYEGRANPVGAGERRVDGGVFRYQTVRAHNSDEIATLWDYRNRYALYKLDPHLQAAHAASPWIVAMDDHEVDNNWAGLTPQDPWAQTDLEFRIRRQAAFRAYYEHMPLREAPELIRTSSRLKLHGLYRMGPARIHLLDTRQYRSDQIPRGQISDESARALLADRDRGMLDAAQEQWLLQSLERGGAAYNVIAQQTWFAPYAYAESDPLDVNMDQWDGYPMQRQRIVDAMSTQRNSVVLSGDWHCASAATLHEQASNPKSPRVGWEFAATSISSHCPWSERVEGARDLNPHVHHTNGRQRGYLRCECDDRDWRSEYRVVEDPYNSSSDVRTDVSVSVRDI
ncbi:MAG: alkaline phosphatase D family protein [Halieaceae bacterium]|jgi:alkaline phosphatase D|nr:alkaline phosphatase D family protein [Halieaceae bacterium]